MSANHEIASDSTALLATGDSVAAADSAAVTAAATDTTTTEVGVPEEYPETNAAQADGNAGLIGWGGIALSICVGVIAWKLIDNLKKEVRTLRDYCDGVNDRLAESRKTIDGLKESVFTLNQRVTGIQQNLQPRTVMSSGPVNRSHERSPRQDPPQRPVTVTRYATLQSPDENGVLRFSERAMSDQPSQQKMFILEINPATGTGIYRINPGAISLIVGDLQMFRDFVKPFTFSGDPSRARIQDRKVGRISRQGNFWVVVEPLEISIN